MTDPANDRSEREEGGEDDETPPTSDGGPSPSANSFTLADAQTRAQEAAQDLLEHQFEGIIKAESNDEGWRTVIEVVERNAVPDTQDIIGRYEITLDETGDVTSYELLERYRRGDMKEEL